MKATYLMAIATAAATMSSNAALIVIDDFNANGDSYDQTAQVNGSSPNAGVATRYRNVNDSTVLGGQRDIAAHRTEATSPGDLGLVQMDINNSYVGQAGYTSTTKGHGHIWYDGANAITTANPNMDNSGLGLDATDSGSNASFHIQAAANTAVLIILEVYKQGSSTDLAKFTLSLPAGDVNSLVDYYLPFSSFIPEGAFSLATDFTTVGAMKLTINDQETATSSVVIDNFEITAAPVPEFHQYAMFAGFGCVGFALLRNRFNRKAA
jgi:hypothetical protein